MPSILRFALRLLDQMKNKLQFNVDDLDKYTVEELRQQVDQAIGQVRRSVIAMSATLILFSYYLRLACQPIKNKGTVGYTAEDPSY